jgi:hypothetical protein
MKRVASCSCGQLRITCEGEPLRTSICHCLDCQKRTGSAFAIQARFRDDQVTIEGRSTPFVRIGDDGGRITFQFCPTCGSSVYYRATYIEGGIAVAIGAFADPGFPAPRIEVYEHRRHPWTRMPDLHVDHEE